MEDLEFARRIRTLAVVAMFSDEVLRSRLVLKGGNLMDLVYDISARSSVDVDFSIDGDFPDQVDLQSRIESALDSTFSGEGYVVFDVRFREVPAFLLDELKSFWGGYQIDFKLISKERFDELDGAIDELRKYAPRVGKGDSPKFEIDLSKHEFCGAKEEYQLEESTIYGQSPAMFVCEKLRAICQQMEEYTQTVRKHRAFRARDFLDIYIAADYFPIDFGSSDFHDTLEKTFAAKRVPLRLLGDMESVREIHRENFETVRATVKPEFPLREYDFYFNYVLARCRDLESLWHE